MRNLVADEVAGAVTVIVGAGAELIAAATAVATAVAISVGDGAAAAGAAAGGTAAGCWSDKTCCGICNPNSPL